MGEIDAKQPTDDEAQRSFVRAVLEDVQALDRMLRERLIESGIRRIGAEQELFLVDKGCRAAPKAMEVLDTLDNPAFTTELASFNLEANLPPYEFSGDFLTRMRKDLEKFLTEAREAATRSEIDVLLTGILPTLQPSDVNIENLTPVPRYAALNAAMLKQRGSDFHVSIKGIDEFYTVCESVMLEACNTSFQVHIQVSPESFAKTYNIAQAATGPVLAAAVNSPILMEKRLWHETRVALFQHSVDDRSHVQLTRGQQPRVRFGEDWIKESILEVFREDVARFRVLLATQPEENSLEVLDEGGVPRLAALCLHNGTCYRWNRACYGTHKGIAHIRIENRLLPAGPTVSDEIANAAFFVGLVAGLEDELDDITRVMRFDQVKENFLAAARHGLHAQMSWGDKDFVVSELILDHLLPRARRGLRIHNVDSEDVDHYLGIIEERVRTRQTGSQWILDSLDAMGDRGPRHQRFHAVTQGMLKRQKQDVPVAQWDLANISEAEEWQHSVHTVGLFMSTDLFTIRSDDVIELATNLMHWRHIRHVPVENEQGQLVGVVSYRDLIEYMATKIASDNGVPVPVREIMQTDCVTVGPDTPTVEALDIMRRRDIGCLPVVSDGSLVGIITDRDFLGIAADLLRDQLKSYGQGASRE